MVDFDSVQPKYYDEKSGEVEEGVMDDPEPVSPASLPGTYNWVFAESIYEIEEKCDKEDGRLILSFKPGDEPTFKNLRGDLHIYSLQGKFKGVKEVNRREPNYWAIKKMKWADESMAEEAGGDDHRLVAYKTCDDNGNRFIQFIWDQGYMGCAPHTGYYLAKKQSPVGTHAHLTRTEKERLGMEMSGDEVKRKARSEAKVKEEPVESKAGPSKVRSRVGVKEESVEPNVKEESVESRAGPSKVRSGVGVKKESVKPKASGSGKRKKEEDEEDNKRALKSLKAE